MKGQQNMQKSGALNCRQARARIDDWLDERGAHMGEDLAAHVGSCPGCRAHVRQWNEIELVLRGGAAEVLEPRPTRVHRRPAVRGLRLAAAAACAVLLLAVIWTAIARPRALMAWRHSGTGQRRIWQAPAGNPGAAVEPRDLPMATTP
jgi:anti-sigma factor RsiW